MFSKKHIPNAITLSRGILVLILVLVFTSNIPEKFWIAYLFFIVASLTDSLDGYLARKWKTVSEFGAIFDPLFDKILTLTLFMLFIPYHILPIIIFILFLIRELLVDGIKNYMASREKIVPAINSAKLKMVFQVIFLHFAFLTLIFPDIMYFRHALLVFSGIALFLAIFSGIIYGNLFYKFLEK